MSLFQLDKREATKLTLCSFLVKLNRTTNFTLENLSGFPLSPSIVASEISEVGIMELTVTDAMCALCETS